MPVRGARYGVGAATGEVTTCGVGVTDVEAAGVRLTKGVGAAALALAEGEGAGGCANGSFNAFKSGLFMTNVPSRSSTRANHIPLPLELPTVNL